MRVKNHSTLKPCLKCGKCCITYPCALSPDDLPRIARFLGLTESELLTHFLVLDYVLDSGQRRYYVCPARKDDEAGRVVHPEWAFSDSPCVFLRGSECAIEEVKPKGGKTFFCSLMTSENRNLIGYGKKKAAKDWAKGPILDDLLVLND